MSCRPYSSRQSIDLTHLLEQMCLVLEMSNAEKKKRVLELFEFEPPPGQRGGSAGSRVEGREWASEMRELLTTSGFIVETAIAKSSDGEHIDGNASERVSYKMLRFKRSPLARGRSLVVALNSAFEQYDNAQISELREQASYLNGLDDRAPIVILSRRSHYEEYMRDVLGW